ncbi:DUF262 domain-containing protein [Tumidithrix elongata RA019]|uniref:DUF262 domain-containing protein n=1 Tax=Tumidithrix elongata BACA0141 TaxID=2716417 RepID=A0AAW9PZ11_9CYAN|nr:DUF262 domain-containing protein [Tumidithrix elongata RA019]
MNTINQTPESSKNYYKQNQIFEDNEVMVMDIETEEEEEIIEPFDPTKIKIDARQITIDLVLNRIKFGEIELSPDFQRESNIWNDVAKSRLIESMLIRIPLPAFYIDATDDNRWIVIDGQQRLTAIKHFVLDKKDAFRLSKLEFLTQFNDKSYDEIPRNYQRRISETQITIYLIEKGTPEELKFNIFRRINTGGLPLSPQEIRHAINQGKATKFLEKLAKSEEFKNATANAIPDKRMAARETVLRFLAFKITYFLQYNATDLDTFLNNAMKTMNNMSDKHFDDLESSFSKAMSAATDIFGNEAFRKRSDISARRMPFNKALFESWSVNLSSLNYDQIELLKLKKDILIDEFIKLNGDRSFIDSISEGTGSIGRVKYRFSKIKELIDKVLNIN